MKVIKPRKRTHGFTERYLDAEVMALAGTKLMGWNFVQRPKVEEPDRKAPRPRERNPWEPQSLGHLIQNPFAGQRR
jgi:hypothetical protein